MDKPELLAPAGSMTALKAAVAAGADAVYLGGTSFGARAYADNFDKQTLVDAIKYCHLYGVKVYLTINTLFRNDEILQLYDFLLPFYQAGLDAVIVQDLGVVKFVHDAFPDLTIHASTQMTITTPYAYDLLRNYGVNRIVPARELSREELKAFRDMDNPPELEVFVQGALCYCYSGQCLMSSFIGGRSGNRGRCAQPCRLPYKVYNPEGNSIETDGEYLLSPKDLCGLSDIGSLIEMGIDSFKIEGRMKKPEYVAACVQAYRMVIDAWFDNCLTEDLLTVCKENMAAVFNRGGFTQGYLDRHNGKNMMSMKNPGNAGVHIGRIVGKNRNQIQVELIRDVHRGDLLSVSLSDSVVHLTCNQDCKSSSVITLNSPKTKKIKVGSKVYRVQDLELESRLSRYIAEDRKLMLSARVDLQVGKKAQLSLKTVTADREYFVTVEGNMVEAASKQPLSKTVVEEKIMQLGNTRYEIEDMEVNLSGNVFYSMKELKELRRCGITALETSITDSYQRVVREKDDDLGCIKDCGDSDVLEEQTPWIEDEEKLPVFEVSTIDQLQILKSYKKMKDIYIDLQYFDIATIMDIVSSKTEFDYWIVLPPVLRKECMKDVLWACQYRADNLKGVVVRNLDEIGILKTVDYQGDLVVDYSMYTMNSYAVDVICDYVDRVMDNRIQENNRRRITFTIPVELNEKQIRDLLWGKQYASNITFQLIVYGYQQLMVSAQCISKNTLGCQRQNDFLILRDRYQKVFYSQAICKYCYHLIYNGNPTVLWDVSSHILSYGKVSSRIHFTMENKEQVSHILDCYNELPFDKERTKGHFSRGVE